KKQKKRDENSPLSGVLLRHRWVCATPSQAKPRQYLWCPTSKGSLPSGPGHEYYALGLLLRESRRLEKPALRSMPRLGAWWRTASSQVSSLLPWPGPWLGRRCMVQPSSWRG
ncbi:unnamed protein product, partial [Discosporangium mesarthrocarpum]